jgi:hypothetical protein
MAHHYICARCGETGYDFDLHKCEGMRDLRDMDHDILLLLCKDEIDEDEAWKRSDEKKKNA